DRRRRERPPDSPPTGPGLRRHRPRPRGPRLAPTGRPPRPPRHREPEGPVPARARPVVPIHHQGATGDWRAGGGAGAARGGAAGAGREGWNHEKHGTARKMKTDGPAGSRGAQGGAMPESVKRDGTIFSPSSHRMIVVTGGSGRVAATG